MTALNGHDVKQPLARSNTDDFWRGKKLTPAQLQIHDVFIEQNERRPDRPPNLEIREELASSLMSGDGLQAAVIEAAKLVVADADLGVTEAEYRQLDLLDDQYAWMQHLRLPSDECDRKVRWM